MGHSGWEVISLAKPRRRHPGWNIYEVSPQGEEYAQALVELLGRDLEATPLAYHAPAHVFLLSGQGGAGLLVDLQESREGECWRHEAGFRVVTSEQMVEGHLTATRWRAWLAVPEAEVRGATAVQKRAWDARTAEIAAERDSLRFEQVATIDEWPSVGLGGATLATLWGKVTEIAPTSG